MQRWLVIWGKREGIGWLCGRVVSGKRGLGTHPKYPYSFKLFMAGSLDGNDWKTRSSMGRESHAFFSSMNPSFCLSVGKRVSMNKLVRGMQ